ncbi:UDP-glycosyltransferase UGT5-like isoform X1 [Periplaneta americana]|uniref:UDP-glycosyltransferase UGT5-like isoform X1 n=1 Tax=Periplaneta americana TaxID=6978 RepID=UPI0037E76A81
MKQITIFIIFATVFFSADTYKILGLFPHVAKSHFLMAEALMKGLAGRGHQVTMVSHFPQKNSISNYTDISLVGSMPEFFGQVFLENVAVKYLYKTLIRQSNTGIVTCKNTLESPEMKKLVASNETFDLVITELFNTDCLLGYVYTLKTPFIALSSSTMMPWAYARFGTPNNPSYIGNQFLYHASDMTFQERIINALYFVVFRWVYYYVYEKPAYEIVKNYFGESLPQLSDIAKNTSLLLVNSHFSSHHPRPLMPAIVEVGGLHLRSSGIRLTKDLQDFLDSAEDGVIYFSLGSFVRVESMPADKRDAFVQAFSELPQKVLWKWEKETLPGKPKNVKIVSWLPQMDVLEPDRKLVAPTCASFFLGLRSGDSVCADDCLLIERTVQTALQQGSWASPSHPNVRVFISHGGLMGTMEAVYHGVPMVAIPLFGDQFHNVKCSVQQGIAVYLDYHTITKESVLSALKEILQNPTFTENAKQVKKAFRDRPVSPLDTAIYWTEYVIRHGGAPHLRSAAVDLQWYQYLLLDVLAVLFLCVAAILATTYLILKKLISLWRTCSGRKQTKNKIS